MLSYCSKVMMPLNHALAFASIPEKHKTTCLPITKGLPLHPKSSHDENE